MQQIKKQSAGNTFLLAAGIAVALSAATFMLPVASTATNVPATHWRAFASTLLFCLFTASTVILLTSLKSFKPGFRSAFRFLAFGFLAFSITLVQFIFWGLLDLWNSDWATSGSGLVPIALGALFLYAGARKFSKLMGVKAMLNSFWLTIGLSVVVAAVMYTLALFFVQYHNVEGVEVYIAICGWGTLFIACAAILVWRIAKSIGTYYQQTMRWMSVALFSLAFETAHEAINTFWFNNGDTYTDYGFYLIPFVVAGFLCLLAAYKFRALSLRTIRLETNPDDAKNASDSDYIDSIVAVGGLASQPQQVETIMDGLRGVTSKLGQGAKLGDDDKKSLLDTYFELEKFLLEQDTLRNYSKEQVRSYVTPGFLAVVQTAPGNQNS